MKYFKIALLLLAGLSGSIQAGSTSAVNIEMVSAGGWDLYYTIRTNGTHNPANCPKGPEYWFFEKTNEFKDAWFAIAMTAKVSGTPVSAYIDDNVCLNGYPKLRRISLGGVW